MQDILLICRIKIRLRELLNCCLTLLSKTWKWECTKIIVTRFQFQTDSVPLYHLTLCWCFLQTALEFTSRVYIAGIFLRQLWRQGFPELMSLINKPISHPDTRSVVVILQTFISHPNI